MLSEFRIHLSGAKESQLEVQRTIVLPTCVFEFFRVLFRYNTRYVQHPSSFQEKRSRIDYLVDSKYRFQEASLHIANEECSICV